MKNLNLRIKQDTKNKLKKDMVKYHVSMSTIADKLLATYIKYKPEQIKPYLLAFNENIKQAPYTTLRPKGAYETGTPTEWQHLYSNILYNFYECEKEQEEQNKLQSYLYRELGKCREIYWNMNEYYRNQARIIKRNKDYWKKVLLGEENNVK